MEVKTPSEQEVKLVATSDTPDVKTEVNPELEKLKELERNKSIALKKEREEGQKLKEEMDELRKFKTEIEEKDKKKKGQYEELLKEKQDLIDSMEEKSKQWDSYSEKLKTDSEAKVTDLMSKLSEEVMESNKEFIEDLSSEKQIKFLERLVESSKKPAFDGEANGGDKAPNDQDVKIEAAKKDGFNGFIRAMIKENV